MDIYPEDFEPAYRPRLHLIRSVLDGTLIKSGQYIFTGALFGIIIGIGLDYIRGFVFHPLQGDEFLITGELGVGAVLGYIGGFILDRNTNRKKCARKVTAAEIRLTRKEETDSLRVEYLDLIAQLIAMPAFQDKSAEESVRSAVRGLGSSIEKLPGRPADELLLDAGIFQAEASRLVGEANQESDPVVAASLLRQSAAQNQSADAISQNFALSRRNHILRQEMSEHIRALKTMLSALNLGDGSGDYDFAALTGNIERIAVEARSLTEAKKELAFALEAGRGSTDNLIRLNQQ